MQKDSPIILFDGVCNLCHSSVQFIIKWDEKSIFRFAALQSETGQRLLNKFKLPTTEFNSFVMVEGDTYFSKSAAALKVCSKLGGLWPLMKIFFICPAFIRDFVYDYVSKNRYHWFGKEESCWIPTPELLKRFV